MSGFSLGGAINAGADWVCNAPIIRTVISNPVFTALLLTALAVIIIMASYHYQIKQAGVKKGVRTILYAFIVFTMVMFVHHYAVTRLSRETASQQGIREVFSSIEQSRESGIHGGVPVVPMGWETNQAVTGGNEYGTAAADTSGGCGCPDAQGPPAIAGRGGRPDNLERLRTNPNNLALDNDLIIEDVIVPAAIPLRR